MSRIKLWQIRVGKAARNSQLDDPDPVALYCLFVAFRMKFLAASAFEKNTRNLSEVEAKDDKRSSSPQLKFPLCSLALILVILDGMVDEMILGLSSGIMFIFSRYSALVSVSRYQK